MKKNKVLILISIITITSLSFLKFYLKDRIINYLELSQDSIDYIYYRKIFEFSEISIVSIILIIVFFVIFKENIKSFIKRVKLKQLFLFCFFFQLIAQILILIFIKTEQISDAYYYLSHGLRLSQTGSFITANGNITAFWPVGVPAIIALFDYLNLPAITSFQFLNIFFSATTYYLIYLLLNNILSDIQLKIFLILYCFYPNNLFITQSILTELPYVFLTWLIFFFYIKYKINKHNYFLIMIGIIGGAAVLFRGNAIILLVTLLIIFSLKFDKPFKKIIFILVGFSLSSSFWIIRNYSNFDSFVLSSTNGGFNFLMGNHKLSNGKINFNFEYDFQNNEILEEKKAYKRAFSDLLENPSRIPLLFTKKIFWSYWRGDHALTWALKKTSNEISPYLLSFLFFFTNLYFYLVISISLFGIVKVRKFVLQNDLIFFLVYFLLNLLLIIMFTGSERYIYPVFTFHIILAVYQVTANTKELL